MIYTSEGGLCGPSTAAPPQSSGGERMAICTHMLRSTTLLSRASIVVPPWLWVTDSPGWGRCSGFFNAGFHTVHPKKVGGLPACRPARSLARSGRRLRGATLPRLARFLLLLLPLVPDLVRSQSGRGSCGSGTGAPIGSLAPVAPPPVWLSGRAVPCRGSSARPSP